jgi:hypothetical protein
MSRCKMDILLPVEASVPITLSWDHVICSEPSSGGSSVSVNPQHEAVLAASDSNASGQRGCTAGSALMLSLVLDAVLTC